MTVLDVCTDLRSRHAVIVSSNGYSSCRSQGCSTAIPTDVPGTATALPPTLPPGGGVSPSFDMVSRHIFEDMHSMHVNVALVAQRLVQNDEIRAMAKHAADGAGLHLLLLQHLKHRLLDNYIPPTTHIEEEYQSPRRFEPNR